MNYCFKFNKRLTEPKVVYVLGGAVTNWEGKLELNMCVFMCLFEVL